jgi:hypothetical protein
VCTTPTPTPTITSTPTPTPTITSTPTPTPTQTGTPLVAPTSTPTPTVTSSQTGTPLVSPTSTPTPTQTGTPLVTPSPTPLPTIFTHGTVIVTCDDFCTANYQIDVSTPADDTFGALQIGDFIYNQGGVAGFVAYAATSTDTATGSFRIAQINTSGQITAISICVGGACDPF